MFYGTEIPDNTAKVKEFVKAEIICGKVISLALLQENPLPLKAHQPGKQERKCKRKYSYNTRNCVTRELRTFTFGKNGITRSGKNAVKVKTCNLQVVKISPKSSPPKITCNVVIQNEKRDGHFQQYWFFGS